MVKERDDHLPGVPFTKECMDADKTVPVVNIPPVRFIGGHSKKVKTGKIQGYLELEILVAVITTVGVPVEEALNDIGMKANKVVINIKYDDKAPWVRSIGEVWTTQIADQWVD